MNKRGKKNTVRGGRNIIPVPSPSPSPVEPYTFQPMTSADCKRACGDRDPDGHHQERGEGGVMDTGIKGPSCYEACMECTTDPDCHWYEPSRPQGCTDSWVGAGSPHSGIWDADGVNSSNCVYSNGGEWCYGCYDDEGFSACSKANIVSGCAPWWVFGCGSVSWEDCEGDGHDEFFCNINDPYNSNPDPVACMASGCDPEWSLGYVGDGWCDFNCNTPECCYDRGDCCPSTCEPGLTYECMVAAWVCLDPNSEENGSGGGGSGPPCMPAGNPDCRCCCYPDTSFKNTTTEECEETGGIWLPDIIETCTQNTPCACGNVNTFEMSSCADAQFMNCTSAGGEPITCDTECMIIGQMAYKFSGAICEYGECGAYNNKAEPCIYGCDSTGQECNTNPCEAPSDPQLPYDAETNPTVAEQCNSSYCDENDLMVFDFCNGENWLSQDFCEYNNTGACVYGCDTETDMCHTYCSSYGDVHCPKTKCTCSMVRGGDCILKGGGFCNAAGEPLNGNDRCDFATQIDCPFGCEYDDSQCPSESTECCAVDQCIIQQMVMNGECEDHCSSGGAYIHMSGECYDGECLRDHSNPDWVNGVEVCFWKGSCDDTEGGCVIPDYCEDGYTPNCKMLQGPEFISSPCCPVNWIGDGWPDCGYDSSWGEQNYKCDLSCYDCGAGGFGNCTEAVFDLDGNDGGDCDEMAWGCPPDDPDCGYGGVPYCNRPPYRDEFGGTDTGICGPCTEDYALRHGICCPDSAAEDMGLSCHDMCSGEVEPYSGEFALNCNGCKCPLDPCFHWEQDRIGANLTRCSNKNGMCDTPDSDTRGGCFEDEPQCVELGAGDFDTAMPTFIYDQHNCIYGCDINGCYKVPPAEWMYLDRIPGGDQDTGPRDCASICENSGQQCYGDYMIFGMDHNWDPIPEGVPLACAGENDWPDKCEANHYCQSFAIGIFSIDLWPHVDQDCSYATGDGVVGGWDCATNGDACGPIYYNQQGCDSVAINRWFQSQGEDPPNIYYGGPQGNPGIDCNECNNNYDEYGVPCCDNAWYYGGLTCAQLDGFGFDCSGCVCPGDINFTCADFGTDVTDYMNYVNSSSPQSNNAESARRKVINWMHLYFLQHYMYWGSPYQTPQWPDGGGYPSDMIPCTSANDNECFDFFYGNTYHTFEVLEDVELGYIWDNPQWINTPYYQGTGSVRHGMQNSSRTAPGVVISSSGDYDPWGFQDPGSEEAYFNYALFDWGEGACNHDITGVLTTYWNGMSPHPSFGPGYQGGDGKYCCCGIKQDDVYCGDGRTRWSYSLGREVNSNYKAFFIGPPELKPVPIDPPPGWLPKDENGVRYESDEAYEAARIRAGLEPKNIRRNDVNAITLPKDFFG